MEQESPLFEDTKKPDIPEQKNAMSRYIVYGIFITVIIIILYNAYSCFCNNRNYFGFLEKDSADDSNFIEEQIEILNKMQKRNLSAMR